MEILKQDYFALFIIISVGYIIGKIKIKGVSLDISAILFVALLFGHYGITMPGIIGKIGLVLFIYTIGIQAGTGFFDSFKKQGRALITISIGLVLSAALLAAACIFLFGVSTDLSIGLLAGALTSTPGLATAIEATHSSMVSIGYGIAYPFGVIGVILFVKLIPKLLSIKISEAEKEYDSQQHSDFPIVLNRNFIIQNSKVVGKTIGQLRVRTMTEAVISRVMKDGDAFTPNMNTKLEIGDKIKAVGTEDALRKIELLLGAVTDEPIPLAEEFEVRSILVTSPLTVNKSLAELNLWKNYNASVTSIRRSSIDIVPTPDVKIKMGDKLKIASNKDSMKHIMGLFGNNDKILSNTNFFPVVTGIVVGVLLGQVTVQFGTAFSFSLGLTGGVLTVAMLLSKIGKTGSIIWTMSGAGNQLLRQIGLMFFLTYVGTKAGGTLVETFNEYGTKLFILGGFITIIPMVVGVILSKFFKINPLQLLGVLTGSMTSTPGLAVVDSMTESNAPSIAYASVYPVAMVLLIICIQILSSIVV